MHHYSFHLTTEWEFEEPFINCLYRDIMHEYYIFWKCKLCKQVIIVTVDPFLNILVCEGIKVLTRAQRKEVGNVESIITSKELRQRREVGRPSFAFVAKTLGNMPEQLIHIFVYCIL